MEATRIRQRVADLKAIEVLVPLPEFGEVEVKIDWGTAASPDPAEGYRSEKQERRKSPMICADLFAVDAGLTELTRGLA